MSYGQSDSLTFSYQEYLENVIRYHPVAKKANLRPALADAELRSARGLLDPELSSDWQEKNFDDKLYYRQYKAALKFPTILGIDVVGGYENTEGVFLNPENTTDEFGLWNVGLEVNILQGLITNERRTALDQARVFQDLAKNEQQILINELVYDASITYLLWQQYYFSGIILVENMTLSQTYFENTKQSFYGGEKTGMDTLEAFILYQDALSYLQKNQMDLTKARQTMENFLWFNDAPVTLRDNTIPEDYQNPTLPQLSDITDQIVNENPTIQIALNKLSYAEIEQKLKREKLKPKLKLKYNPLLSTSNDGIRPNYSVDNYQYGFDFSMPLFMRSERADVQKGQIKITELELEIENKRNELLNKIENSLLQQQLLIQQFNLLSQNVENYNLLLEGENELFNFGESSVFLLNKRQEKYIEGQLKLIDLQIKQKMELLNYLYYTNKILTQ
jgi:outer membrane protein TolC